MVAAADTFEKLEDAFGRELTVWSSSASVAGCATGESARIVKAAARLRNRLAAIETEHLANAAAAPEFKGAGCSSTADKVAKATGRSATAAKKAIETSKAISELPELRDAMQDGDLSPEQVSLIADAAKNDGSLVSELVEKARTEDFKGLRDACDRAKAASEPDPESKRKRIHAKRRVQHWWGSDGARYGMWAMTGENAAEVEHVLDAFTEGEYEKARKEGRRESFEAYRADGLLAMARAAQGGGDPQVKVPKELIIRCDYASFVRGHTHPSEVCEVRGMGPVPVSVAREIADDCFLKALFHDGVDVRLVKHFGRYTKAELRTALMDRDQVCSEPGCNKAHRLEGDHIVPVAQGGVTSQENKHGKCQPSHREKTRSDNAKTRRLKRDGKLPGKGPGQPAGGVTGGPAGGGEGPPGPGFDQPDDPKYTEWRARIRAGGPPPDVDPFSPEGQRYR
jgi:hypothetical protein